MKKLKPIAYELINLKREILNENYSQTIKQALEISVDQMLEKGFIDLDTQLYVKDKNHPLDKFITYLEETDVFKKTIEELEMEYEEFIGVLKSELISLGLDEEDFYCKVDMNNERVKICKVFSLKAEFLKSFFYFNGDSDDEYLEKLMKRKGFIEKFAILRLPRIFFNFIDSYEGGNSFSLEKTYPYFDSSNHCYSIDLVFDINIDDIENDENRINVLNEILPIIYNANNYFKEKMSI